MILPALFKKRGKEDASDDTAPASKPPTKRAVVSARKRRRPSHARRSYRAPSADIDRPPAYDVLSRPVITEKAADLSEKKVYAFFVHERADKFSVANAVEAVYGVRPEQVRIARRPSKRKQIRGRKGRPQYGFTSSRKKAYVALKPGDSISLT